MNYTAFYQDELKLHHKFWVNNHGTKFYYYTDGHFATIPDGHFLKDVPAQMVEILTFSEYLDQNHSELGEMFDLEMGEATEIFERTGFYSYSSHPTWFFTVWTEYHNKGEKVAFDSFCFWNYHINNDQWGYPTKEQFDIIWNNDQVAKMDLQDIERMKPFLSQILDELLENKEVKGILGIDSMNHQDAQTFRTVSGEIISSTIANA